jgi:hypothetical protein
VRTRSVVLLGAGVFLLTLAAMIRFYAFPRMTSLPLNYYIETTSEASGATVFDLPTLSERSGATVTAVRTIKGDAKAGSADVAVWDVFQNVQDEKGNKLEYTQSRVPLDRQTALPVHCCRENLNGDRAKQFEGYTYKFPYNIDKRSYQVFNDTTARAWPMQYAATETVKGLTVYRFEQPIPPTKVAEREVPGHLVGAPDQPTVVADRYYTTTRTYWVEPRTGIIVKGQEDAKTTLRGPSGEDAVTLMEGKVTLVDKDVQKMVDTANSARLMLMLLGIVIPLVAALLGAALVAIALFESRRRGRRAKGTHATRGPVESPTPVG